MQCNHTTTLVVVMAATSLLTSGARSWLADREDILTWYWGYFSSVFATNKIRISCDIFIEPECTIKPQGVGLVKDVLMQSYMCWQIWYIHPSSHLVQTICISDTTRIRPLSYLYLPNMVCCGRTNNQPCQHYHKVSVYCILSLAFKSNTHSWTFGSTCHWPLA